MTGTVAQLIALVAHGNQYLKTKELPQGFYPENTVFQFCNRVNFREFHKAFLSSKMKEVVVAENPLEWFKKLKREGCKSLRLCFELSNNNPIAKDYKLAGMVGGGGIWLIEAIYNRFSDFWANRWEVTNPEAPDRKIWTVQYGLTAPQHVTLNQQFDIAATKEKLSQTLRAITAFAREQGLQDWALQFEGALAALDEAQPFQGMYYKDLLPEQHYGLEARQVFAASAKAWVFGGMGSWNDLGFEQPEVSARYEELSERLYAQMIEGMIACVNSY